MGWKKILLFVLIPIIIVVSPVIMVSNPMMDYYQTRIDKDPKTGFHEWLQFSLCWVCRNTMRYERASRGYERYLDHFDPEDAGQEENYPYASFQYAYTLESQLKYEKAKMQYEIFMDAYPQHVLYEDAVKAIRRIKYQSPH